MIDKDEDKLIEIGKMGKVLKSESIVGEKRGDNKGKGRVFREGNGNKEVEIVEEEDFNEINDVKIMGRRICKEIDLRKVRKKLRRGGDE